MATTDALLLPCRSAWVQTNGYERLKARFSPLNIGMTTDPIEVLCSGGSGGRGESSSSGLGSFLLGGESLGLGLEGLDLGDHGLERGSLLGEGLLGGGLGGGRAFGAPGP